LASIYWQLHDTDALLLLLIVHDDGAPLSVADPELC